MRLQNAKFRNYRWNATNTNKRFHQRGRNRIPIWKKMCCTLNEELTCYSSDQDCVDQVKKSHERIASTIKIMCKKYKYDEVCIQKPEPESESEAESAAEPENGAYRNMLSVFTLLPSLCILLRRYCWWICQYIGWGQINAHSSYASHFVRFLRHRPYTKRKLKPGKFVVIQVTVAEVIFK